jgi:hypothetical protein
MHVAELRALLADLPDKMLVVRADNSGGYEDIYTVRKDQVYSPPARENLHPAIVLD